MFEIDFANRPYRRPRQGHQGWGRAVLLAAALIVATSAIAYGKGPIRTEDVVVGEGDTLWSIAASHYPGDPRPRIDEIIRVNHLATPVLQPGQQLELPQQ